MSNTENYGFVENKGQIVDQDYRPNPSIRYLLSRSGCNVQLRQTGFSYDTFTEEKGSTDSSFLIKQGTNSNLHTPIIRHYHRVDIELLNCNKNAQIIVSGKSDSYFNYFTAGVPEGGVSYIYSYSNVIYKNIYPNIDLEFYIDIAKNSSNHTAGVEYRFILHPGAIVNNIQLSYQGAKNIILENNQLKIEVTAGTFTENIPSSYFDLTKQRIEVKYQSIGSNIFSFYLPGNISITSDLIIDPVPCLDWGTYYGGDILASRAIAVDSSENVFITGVTTSTSNIATAGAYQVNYNGYEDAYVAKFNPTGSTLLWGSYYGGTNDDFGYSIAVDSKDNPYITGHTDSHTNIATAGAYLTNDHSSHAFVAKFNSTGSSLLWGTYLEAEQGYGIALDSVDNVFITGSAFSTDSNIATPGAYQASFSGAFIAKLNSTGSSLLWGTYYGGIGANSSWGLALDRKDNIFITGTTNSQTKIATPGSYQPTWSPGISYAFVAKFNSTGSSLLWGTYYGGGEEDGRAIAIDPSDNVYITGITTSSTNIATPGAFQTIFSGTFNGYVAKFDPTGSSLLWGTYCGGQDMSIAVDSGYNVYVTGIATGWDSVSTPGSYQPSYGGNNGNAFISKFNTTCSLQWGTFYGGSGGEEGEGIALDSKENIYLTGYTRSKDSIATVGAFETVLTDSCAYVAKFGCNSYCNLASVNLVSTKSSVCIGDSLTFSITGGRSSYKYLWSPGGQTNSVIHITPSITSTYTLLVRDTTGGCVKSIMQEVIVYTIPKIILTGKDSICIGSSTILRASGGGMYSWNTGSTNDSIIVNPVTTTVYTIQVTNGACVKDTNFIVNVDTNKPIPIVSSTKTICKGDSVQINASDGVSYVWIPVGSLNSSTISNPMATPKTTTTYTVFVTKGVCKVDDSVLVIVNPLPKITLSGKDSICLGDSANLSATGGGSYSWSTGATSSSIYVNPITTSTYTLQVNNKGCLKDTSLRVVVNPTPKVSIVGITSICEGKTTTLTASGGTTYIWSNGATTATIVISPISNSNYIVTTYNGPCLGKDSVRVNVNTLPVSSTCCDSIINAGQTVYLSSNGGVSYSWTPPNGLSCDNCPNPLASPIETTTYFVTVTSDSGCVIIETVTIDVNCHVFVPDAFSPNNDGQNDYLYVRGECIKTMDFKIFDRWGNMIFESNSLNNGWDGKFNGQPMNTGTYVYFLEATTYDGNTFTKKGNVALVR